MRADVDGLIPYAQSRFFRHGAARSDQLNPDLHARREISVIA
jgi:hypothetical protein